MLSSFWLHHASLLNFVRPTTPVVRHNFRSIDELLSLTPSPKHNSQLSTSVQSDESSNSPKPSKKKTKKIRTAFTDEQKQYLDRSYSMNRYPDPTEMEALSRFLSLEEKVIRVWFQNKRSREKLHVQNSS